MMRRLKNGEPVFHTHQCAEERRGKVMMAKELHNFAVQVLMNEYAETNVEVIAYDKQYEAEPDFFFINNGKRPNFSVGISGVRKVNVLVVCREDENADISDIDTSWLVDDYRRHGIIPRITFAYAYCLSAEEGNNGKPAICGADFCFKYYSVSVIPGEENAELNVKLSAAELATKYAEAWNNLDASIVEPYLDKDFHYAFDRVFDELPCRAEYIDYFKAKLKFFGSLNYKLETFVGRNHQTKQVCLIVNTKNLSALVLDTKNGRIVSARLQDYDRKFKPFDPEDELYMTHGDHIDAIMPTQLLMQDYLDDIVSDAVVWKRTHTQITTENMYEDRTEVVSLMFGDKDIRLLTLIAYDRWEGNNMFVSMYPICKGASVEVLVNKVIEWDNQVEATVYCSVGNFSFAFFAVDYYCNKRKYKVGSTLTMSIAALAMNAKEAQRGFAFEGQQAIDWLAKLGQTPTYDENGNVEPIKFSMEHLVSFIHPDTKCPDEAEFQSPVSQIEPTSILGIDFFKTMITINREDTENNSSEVVVPLYFRQDFFPTIKHDDPISGWIWLTGSIVGQHEQDECKAASSNMLGKMAADFEQYMDGFDFKNFSNIMFVLKKLQLLKIREGYELDAFWEGSSIGSVLRPYCCKKASNIRYIPSECSKYDDSMYIEGMIDYAAAKSVPNYMPYFDVPFTPEGIMQAWLLNNLEDFMPRNWHACYGSKTYVFDTSILEDMFSSWHTSERMKVKDKVLALDLEALLPKISINENHATLEYAYWNDWTGLAKVKIEVDKEGDGVKFSEPISDVLVAFKSEIRF